jgi:hypothetical protein
VLALDRGGRDEARTHLRRAHELYVAMSLPEAAGAAALLDRLGQGEGTGGLAPVNASTVRRITTSVLVADR